MQTPIPQSCRYLAQVQIFEVYCQDYKFCQQLLNFYTDSFTQFQQIMESDLKSRRTDISNIASKVVCNVADVYIHKISQAMSTLSRITESLTKMRSESRQKSVAMGQIRQANALRVRQSKEKLEILASKLNNKEIEFDLLCEKIKEAKGNIETMEIISANYGNRPTRHHLEPNQIEWKIEEVENQVKKLRGELDYQRAFFEAQSREEVERLKAISRKLFDLSHRLPGNNILIRQKSPAAKKSKDQNPTIKNPPFKNLQQNNLPSEEHQSEYENSRSETKKLKKVRFESYDNLLQENEKIDSQAE